MSIFAKRLFHALLHSAAILPVVILACSAPTTKEAIGATMGAFGLPCTTDGECDDGIGCTIDVCQDGSCAHSTSDAACSAREFCLINRGCVQGKDCVSDGDCADEDPCSFDERWKFVRPGPLRGRRVPVRQPTRPLRVPRHVHRPPQRRAELWRLRDLLRAWRLVRCGSMRVCERNVVVRDGMQRSASRQLELRPVRERMRGAEMPGRCLRSGGRRRR